MHVWNERGLRIVVNSLHYSDELEKILNDNHAEILRNLYTCLVSFVSSRRPAYILNNYININIFINIVCIEISIYCILKIISFLTKLYICLILQYHNYFSS